MPTSQHLAVKAEHKVAARSGFVAADALAHAAGHQVALLVCLRAAVRIVLDVEPVPIARVIPRLSLEHDGHNFQITCRVVCDRLDAHFGALKHFLDDHRAYVIAEANRAVQGDQDRLVHRALVRHGVDRLRADQSGIGESRPKLLRIGNILGRAERRSASDRLRADQSGIGESRPKLLRIGNILGRAERRSASDRTRAEYPASMIEKNNEKIECVRFISFPP